MQKQAKHKIVIIGCGNIAWHLAKQLSSLKENDVFVYNHKPNILLADFKVKLKCHISSDLNEIIPAADLYFICVTDKFISATAKRIRKKNKNALLVHTSGSVKLDELGKGNSAVFYPLQTFSKKDEINWKELPIIIETKHKAVKNKIFALAKKFSNNITVLNYKERLKLHLAAVLVNNFTNALVVAAGDLVSKNNNIKLLLPLIKQTVNKLEKMDARAAQTGPARREDNTVMKRHIKLLEEDKDMQKLYKQLSQLIVKQQAKKHA